MLFLIFLRRINFNIIFAGTPVFAAEALASLIKAGHRISLVLTKPDSASGRGTQLYPSAVKTLALEHNLPLYQPKTLKDVEVQDKLKEFNADFMVVAAYGLILPQAVLDIPKNGCINIHASLLPRWRGAAPIQRAILAGDSKTGITLIKMDAGLDTGNMLLKQEVPILDTDTASSLHDKLMLTGANSIVEYLADIEKYKSEVQDETLSCYADKLKKSEAIINWSESADTLSKKIRAYNPMPASFTYLNKSGVLIWNAHVCDYEENTATPGQIVNTTKKLIVATGNGFIEIEELQLAGSKRMATKDFLAGHPKLLNNTFSNSK